MLKSIPVGISFPKEFVEKIDKDRKDVSRSRFLLKLLERSYEEEKIQLNSLDFGFAGLESSESHRR